MVTMGLARPGLGAGTGDASLPLPASALIDERFFGRACNAAGCASFDVTTGLGVGARAVAEGPVDGFDCGAVDCCTKGFAGDGAVCDPPDDENGMNAGFCPAAALFSRAADMNGLGWSVNSVSFAGAGAAGCGLDADGSGLKDMAGIGKPHFWHTVSLFPRAMNCAPQDGQITMLKFLSPGCLLSSLAVCICY